MRPRRVREKEFFTDTLIVGGGMSGLAMASVLGSSGISALVLERETLSAGEERARLDGRTVAISYGSMRLLERAGVWSALAENACPILDIRVADQAAPEFLDFHSKEVGDHPFGWIVEIRDFLAALRARVKRLKNVRLVQGAAMETLRLGEDAASVRLQDGRAFRAPLAIAADGRNSACRAAAGIETYGWGYGQTALVCSIAHEKPHYNVAVEHFLPAGPLATLPMQPQAFVRPSSAKRVTGAQNVRGKTYRSSIVWSERTATAEYLMKLSDADFTAALQEKVRGWLGTIRLAGPRNAYPLSLKMARRITARRLALIGDAAHGIHPIAGQGFNLGIGDIGALAESIAEGAALGLDTGDATILRAYEKRRRFPNGNMVLMTDALDRLFRNALPPVEAARRFGLAAVQKLPPLRRFFMREAMAARG